ncbi:MAG TPA: formate dehydrogenase accessory protein FdhE [Terriglobales bacterium]|nr:formate dehydrogenase accessory protein FdhE [Terriglobales bacterium]
MPDNLAMGVRTNIEVWQRRIARAEELEARYTFAAQILRFYAAIARLQANLYFEIEDFVSFREMIADGNPFSRDLDPAIVGSFPRFVSIVEENAPEKLRDASRELCARTENSTFEMLADFWRGGREQSSARGAEDFFARAFLQPFAVALRERSNLKYTGPTAYVCPFCKRKPGAGVLCPLGEGAQRSLICSFCLGEWEFRRILCPGCGEGDPAKLPVYTADELKHVRVEACDSCKSYIKTVDFTKSALGEAVVDEIASVPLDLWAQGQGYHKVQVNLMQL